MSWKIWSVEHENREMLMKSGGIKGSYELPEGWHWARLGEVCEKPQYGYTASAEYATVGPKFLRITDIQNGKVNWDTVPYCRCEKGVDHYLLRPGDILFARTGGTTGKSYLISKPPVQTIFASYLIRVRTGNTIIPEYLYQFLQSGMYWEQVESNKRGGAQPNMNATLLSRITLPLPTLEEQQRIATKLQELMHEVDRARTACEQQLEAAKGLPATYLRAVFESEEAEKWEKKRLGEVCEFEYGSGLPERDRIRGSIPVYGSNGVVGYHNIAVSHGATIIIGRKGSIGQINYSGDSCWPIDTTYYIDLSKTRCDLIWLYWLLKWLRLDLLNKATGVPGLNREDAYSQIITLPQFSEQKRIATDLKAKMAEVENLRTAIEKRLEAINALPQAILQKAFRGEL
jgi:type I restriction enzyme S subunit